MLTYNYFVATFIQGKKVISGAEEMPYPSCKIYLDLDLLREVYVKNIYLCFVSKD